MIDGGPFHGGASAELVIDNESQFLGYIENCFQSVIGVASFSGVDGKLKFKLVGAENGAIIDALRHSDQFRCVSLPLFIVRIKDHAPSDTSPKPVG